MCGNVWYIAGVTGLLSPCAIHLSYIGKVERDRDGGGMVMLKNSTLDDAPVIVLSN
jgi:hypothetical protein